MQSGEVFYIDSESDHEKLLDALETRNGKIIVKVTSGIPVDEEENKRNVYWIYYFSDWYTDSVKK